MKQQTLGGTPETKITRWLTGSRIFLKIISHESQNGKSGVFLGRSVKRFNCPLWRLHRVGWGVDVFEVRLPKAVSPGVRPPNKPWPPAPPGPQPRPSPRPWGLSGKGLSAGAGLHPGLRSRVPESSLCCPSADLGIRASVSSALRWT